MGTPPKTPFVGVGVLVVNGDAWLLMRRKTEHGRGTWSTPGGHLDFGESPADCARREVIEETGLAVGDVEFIGITNDVFDSERHYVTLWFAAKTVLGEARIAAPKEVAELAWFRKDELPEPLFAPLRRLVDGDFLGSASSVIRER